MQSPEVIEGRYQILKQLERGKVGHSYLAKDTHRFNELCVVQESDRALNSNAEQFEGAAHILYRLQHPQIPNFRALFSVKGESSSRWYLVRDYVEGQTYRYYLDERRSQGSTYSEAEAIQLLLKILPVLDYVHHQGAIYGKIAPETLLLRDRDRNPILIDFSSAHSIASVPEASAKDETEAKEQIAEDTVSFHADLYGLAVTILELLLPEASSDLLLSTLLTGNWRKELNLSPNFSRILERMLSQNWGDRFESARDAIEALENLELPPDPTAEIDASNTDTLVTVSVADPESATVDSSETNATMASPSSSTAKPLMSGCAGKIVLVLMLILVSGTLGWFAGKLWLSHMAPSNDRSNQTSGDRDNANSVPQARISEEELKRRANLQARRQDLGIDKPFFTALVNQVFLIRYPDRKGNLITDKAEDAQWREKWDGVAEELLSKLSFLSQEARQGLGNYNEAKRDRWKQEINQFHLSSRALYDLADAAFFYRFPEAENQSFIEQPLGQVWHAIVLDKLRTIEAGGEIYEKITMSPEESLENLAGTLQPGEGKAYVVSWNVFQKIDIELKTDGDVLLSIYSPTGQNNLLEDSPLYRWSGTLPETGFYELTVVSKAKSALDYRLSLQDRQ